MSPRWTSYIVPKTQRLLKNAKYPKCEQKAAITPKWYLIGCQLRLITNGKSHKGFCLVPTLMTLNDLEWRNSPYFAFFHWIRLPVALQGWKFSLVHLEISHLYSLRDFWRHFGLCRAAAHSDCYFFALCTNILTYLLITYFAGQLRYSGWTYTCNVRKILSPSSSLPHLAITNPPCSTVSLR